MTPQPSPHYKEYVTKMKVLKLLKNVGLDDTEHTSSLRDEMDKIWWELSPDERERVKGPNSEQKELKADTAIDDLKHDVVPFGDYTHVHSADGDEFIEREE